ncbi:MAG TPA: tripartite tricarboxylate transporter substrate binding protein [Burkholderiales bacterium]|nr:tripartite tricarboxylate transporter substrate binding protein [Burkholderiales bacterium]
MNHTILLVAAGMMLAGALHTALAQTAYPNRPVRVIVTVGPGAGIDSFARVVTKELSDRAGQQFFVDNRPGAGTIIGTQLVAKAKPDGYTLLLTTSSFGITPAIYRSIPYDPFRDFAPIMVTVSNPNVITVHPSVPAKTIGELIALAKTRAKQGDPILYASGGAGTNGHMATALFENMAGIHMMHVPYKSGPLGAIDLMAGQVAVMTDPMGSLMPYVRTGKLRALAVTSARRATAAPDVPTVAESGVPGYESAQWYGLFGPAATPQDILTWLHKEHTAVLHLPSVKARLAVDGLDVVANSPNEFAAFIKAEIAKWTQVVKAQGMDLM